MLRVTRIETLGTTTLKLEGKLVGIWVDEVKNCWTKLTEQKIPVNIDLQGLSFVDASGAALLLDMERQSTGFVGVSTFIRCLLHPEPLQNPNHHEPTAKES